MANRLATRADVSGELGTPAGVAPELNAITDAVHTVWLGIAATLVSTRRFRDETSEAHALLTAHLMTAAGVDGNGSGEAGPIVAAADGPASVTYAAPPTVDTSEAGLATTFYGRTFLEVRKRARGRGSGVVARRGWRWG